MKKLLALLTTFVLVLAGCVNSNTPAKNPCENRDVTKVALVTDTGGINDKSFNQGSWEGIQQYCSETGNGATYIETKSDSEIDKNLTTASEGDGIEVVVASGFKFSSSVATVAQAHPDVDYILIDATPTDANGNTIDLPNVHSYLFSEEQAGYLVGYIAGKMTKTNSIGFVGGESLPAVQKFGFGYITGAQAANPDINIDFTYSNTFNDTTISKSIAGAQINKDNVDIIFTAAGGANGGVISAVKEARTDEKPIWAIGVDMDMYDQGYYKDSNGEQKSVILTSAIKNVGSAAYNGIISHDNGSFVGEVETLTYADGGVGLPETNPNLADNQDVIDEAKASLENTPTIPTTQDEIKQTITTATVNGSLV